MSPRARLVVLALVVVVVAGAAAAYAWSDLQRARAVRGTPPSVPTARAVEGAADGRPAGAFLAFRHTGLDAEYGVVATVPLDDPGGPRTFTGTPCDRVDASRVGASCLVTERGVVTTFLAQDLDAAWDVVGSTPLAGLPSRTRLSPDGALVASTSFVTGHSYQQTGFSTATVVRRPGGTDYGNLESFDLVVDGRVVEPVDRNLWGVTFAGDDDTFYATVATAGRTHLVRGDLSGRTLTVVADHVECPSLSPDGTRVAFKQAVRTDGADGADGWTPAVLDLATGTRTVLDEETRSVDDQLEWLDDDTVLYGLPRPDEAGVTDVWALDTRGGAAPRVLVAQAWSPSVVR